MIKSHLNGYDTCLHLKKVYPIELELICLNSEFFDITKDLIQAKHLASEYPHQVVLKESEFHDEKQPYYEISVFCNEEDESKFTAIINGYGLKVDIVHKK